MSDSRNAQPTSPPQFSRQSGLVPLETLRSLTISVVGVGAVGHQVCRALASMGAGTTNHPVRLYDPETIAEENLASQQWRRGQLSMYKTAAAKDEAINLGAGTSRINPVFESFPRRFQLVNPPGDIIFLLVDTFDSRRFIWNAIWKNRGRRPWQLMIDTRMSGESFLLYGVRSDDPEATALYPRTILSDSEVPPESCTVRSTCYCSMVTAALAIESMVKYLRGQPVPFRLTGDLLTPCIIEETTAQVLTRLGPAPAEPEAAPIEDAGNPAISAEAASNEQEEFEEEFEEASPPDDPEEDEEEEEEEEEEAEDDDSNDSNDEENYPEVNGASLGCSCEECERLRGRIE